MIKPDIFFETSWEVCNKVGGIYTVISTKALSVIKNLNGNYILIGPDILKHESDQNEFIEDPNLYLEWRKFAASEGIRVRIGKWDIAGKPTVILVDFSGHFGEKDSIFSHFWEKYKLDSITGQWDYIEPALFGYAAGKVIESFVKYNANRTDKIVAQFHEWMTGVGVLYLKDKLPQVGTAFTTHATAAGRALAGSYKPLYSGLQQYNSDDIARDYNFAAKHSLEKIAAQNADVFTTVSSITGEECKYLLKKEIDFVTPNGFDFSFVPSEDQFNEKQKTARNKLIEVASGLLGPISNDPFLIVTSGRYEFKNKGIDVLIDSLGKLNNSGKLEREVIAYFLIPTQQYGHRKDLLNKIQNTGELTGTNNITHNLNNPESDLILTRFREAGLNNAPEDKVKVIFVPSYLNGHDGIFNMRYYELLIGFDLSVFCSYYEPWGYTPLESLAFSIPTITSSLAGFGTWVNDEHKKTSRAIVVVNRNDDNHDETVTSIYDAMLKYCKINTAEYIKIKKEAFESSKIALWENFMQYYLDAYDIALLKARDRSGAYTKYRRIGEDNSQQTFIFPKANQPNWRSIIVKSNLPERLVNLQNLAYNLWWTWDYEAQDMFHDIDPEMWAEVGLNPIKLFENLSYEKWVKLAADDNFVAKINSIYARFEAYMKEGVDTSLPKLAYFSMEFGFHDVLKTFSGGLGLLAGDYLKEASDRRSNLVGLGILYRYGYFKQSISMHGDQLAEYDYQVFSKLPVQPLRDEEGNFRYVLINLPGRTLYSRIWKVSIGRINLMLLDTDFELNLDEDRNITHTLYGGDNENRLKQEILLGIGGIRVLEELDIQPDIFHSNEGHSAFIGLERLRKFIWDQKLTFAEAKEVIRASTLFTTHTPVPAGHDEFDENLIRKYMSHYPERLNISWQEFMSLGRSNPYDNSEKFNMSHLACHLAQEVNGVSWLHGEVSKKMFAHLWPGYFYNESHIGYVTNGVHYHTWAAREWQQMLQKYGAGVDDKIYPNKGYFDVINDVPDKLLWETKQGLKTNLINFIKSRYNETYIKKQEDPKHIVAINDALRDDVLTIGFARRFATYKRAHLLFRNIDRLCELVNHPKHPVQFLFAGKAHPHDKAGQDLIKMIFELSKRPEFLGKILFLQNYDINLAKHLVQGVDVWLNTPTRPLEASGTSGEKAVMNGTLHFSVLDGWWVEGYKKDAGWMLPLENTYDNSNFQDELDAETIYSIIENQIVPDYYKRTKENVPDKWVKYIRNCFTQVSPEFTMTRQIRDYYDRFYLKLNKRKNELSKDEFLKAEEITAWKRMIAKNWDSVEVIDLKTDAATTNQTFFVDNEFNGKITLRLGELSPADIGVQMVVTKDRNEVIDICEALVEKIEGSTAIYSCSKKIPFAGAFVYGVRIYPKNVLLPYQQDMGFIKWV